MRKRHPDNGDRNKLKMRVLSFLKLRQECGREATRVLMIREALPGVSGASLHTSILTYYKWGYVDRVRKNNIYFYFLTNRGRDYLTYQTTESLSAPRYKGIEANTLACAKSAVYWIDKKNILTALLSPYTNADCVRSEPYTGDTPHFLYGFHLIYTEPHGVAFQALKIVEYILGVKKDSLNNAMVDELVRRDAGIIYPGNPALTNRLIQEGAKINL